MTWPAATPMLRWVGLLVLTSLALLGVRSSLDKAHVALALLLVVLGASAEGGRTLGIGIAFVAFLIFNYLFLPPFGTLSIANPLDWLVLVAFFVTSLVAAQLLFKAQGEAATALRRAAEIDRLALVGAQALKAVRAIDALGAVTEAIRSEMDADRCAVFLLDERGDLATIWPDGGEPPAARNLAHWVVGAGAGAAELPDGTTRLGEAGVRARSIVTAVGTLPVAILLPLAARGLTVGVLRIERTAGLTLDAARWRFVDALSHYVSLAAERVQVAAAIERAAATRAADTLKDAVLASVSHDLRTPLTTIKALAHDLASTGDERAQIIVEEADRLNRFVRDLLDLSRLNAGALPLNIELNAVDELLGATLQAVEGSLKERRIDVALPPDGTLLVGRFDLTLSIRVLVNLVENADKYSPRGESIDLTAMRDGDSLRLAVADRGLGIAPAEVHRVFTPFFRATDQTRDAGSAGLGLSIARRFAEIQGGSLGYELRPGGGSRFTLSLPAATLEQANGQTGEFTKS